MEKFITYEESIIQELIDNGFMTQEYVSKKYYVGSEWFNRDDEPYTIIGRDTQKKNYYYTQFYNNPEVIRSVFTGNIDKGTNKNPYTPNIHGIGYFGENDYGIIKNHRRAYEIWSNMMARCYSDNYHIKYPTYKNVMVCDDWCNFQNFGKWFNDNYIEGYHLDKDLLSEEAKIYSPETCIFIPPIVNTFLACGKSIRLILVDTWV